MELLKVKVIKLTIGQSYNYANAGNVMMQSTATGTFRNFCLTINGSGMVILQSVWRCNSIARSNVIQLI